MNLENSSIKTQRPTDKSRTHLHIHKGGKMKQSLVYILLYLFPFGLFAVNPVVIDSSNIQETNFWMGKHMMILADPEGKLSIDDVLTSYQDKFKPTKEAVPLLPDDSYFWIKLSILKKTNDDFSWIFECYDQSIDLVEFYYPDKAGVYKKLVAGELIPFGQKQYQHKNFLFDLKLEPGKEQVLYLRVRDKMKMAMIGAVRNQQSLMNYALSEYFYLSLFYGLVLCMILVAIAYYISSHKKIYLHYLFYLFAVFFYTLCSDGLGFQFIWSEFPYFNNEIRVICMLLVISFFYIFTRSFLGELKIDKRLNYLILSLIGLRVIDSLMQLSFSMGFLQETYIDILIRSLLFYSVFTHFKNGEKHLRFLLIAMISVLVGYAVRELAILNVLPNTYITIYMNLFGESIQMIFITIALSEQLKLQLEASIKSQEESMREMEKMHAETQSIKDNLQDQINQQVAQEKFLSEGLSKLNSLIASFQQEPGVLYKHLSSFMANQFNFGMVAFYLPDMTGEHALLKSGYGLDSSRLSQINQPISHGLIGQCLKSKEKIILENIPENFLSIESGLGTKSPTMVVIQPLLFNEKLVGILEYASFHHLSELEFELLNRVTDQISSILSYSAFTEVTSSMLEESHRKEDELRIKQEELNQQLEEMIATHEEHSRREEALLAEIERLKSAKK